MKKTFLYVLLSMVTALAVLLATMVIYKEFFVTPPPKSPIIIKKTAPKKDKIAKLETTLLEVKRKEKTDVLTVATEIEDYITSQKHKDENRSVILVKPSCKVVTKSPKKKRKVFHDHIPRLAIIMDDIGNAKQEKAFEKIPFAMTPSIFPATKRHPNTPQFAKKFKCYMVHMPMEAFHFAHPEENTLEVSDTLETIEKKIANMHQDFPNAIAINNHTGSKFTSNSVAMDKLFCVLDKYDIDFIDSKTAPHSKGKTTGKLHNKVVLERNIFLDNEPDVDYIRKQLKKAVRYAKRHGVAIAICHPRPETFEALSEAEDLLKGVKMVFIDELYD